MLFLGLAVGVLAGWVSLISGDGPAALATVSARFFLALALLLPLGLLAQVYLAGRADMARPNQPGGDGQSFAQAMVELLVAALLGSVGGSLFFVGAAGQIPAVFGGESAAEIVVLLYPAIGWGRFWVVCLATVGAAIGGAVGVSRRG